MAGAASGTADGDKLLNGSGSSPGWLDKGLGWNLERVDADTRWFFHSGSNAGRYKTFAVGDPQRRRGLVVMTSGGGGTGVYQRIVRAATGRDLLAFDL